mmetsp:Transcript_35790/g.98657  ORF Transcript_35790/g.98657 Transcript_35790/m.98657 type:complete len:281 (+) Transcript_35790:316-1158(+)
MSGRRGARYLQRGVYALIPEQWRQKWLHYVQGSEFQVPPLDLAALRCRHGDLQYDPSQHFLQQSEGLKGKTHPHGSFYTLVPMMEATQLLQVYPPLGSTAGEGVAPAGGVDERARWCCLECQALEIDGKVVRTYDVHPKPCALCISPASTNVALDVSLRDERGSEEAAMSEAPDVGPLCININEGSSGLEVKEEVLTKSELKGVVAGQLLIFVDDSPFGDDDVLRQVMSAATLKRRRASLTVEIHTLDMAAPSPKRRRCGEESSSLLKSTLALGTRASCS